MTTDALPAVFDGRLFVSVQELAEVFDYDERTVRQAIKDGQIPATKVGATWRVPTAWVRAQALLDGAA